MLRIFFRILFFLCEFLMFDWLIEEAEETEVDGGDHPERQQNISDRAQRRRERRERRERHVRGATLRTETDADRVSMVIEESPLEVEIEEKQTTKREEEGLGSECETTTEEGLKCTPDRDLSSSGFGSTPSPNKSEAANKENGTVMDTSSSTLVGGGLSLQNGGLRKRH